jgi:hypothetical protein
MYGGRTRGEEDFYGYISVAKPYAKTGHLSWGYQWGMACETETPIAPTTPVGCSGAVRINGWVKRTFTDPALGQECTAKLTNGKGAQWSVGASPRSATTVLLQAGPPDAAIVTIPNPRSSNCGRDQAIRWKYGPGISAPVVWNGPPHSHARPGRGSGEYVDSTHGDVVRGRVSSQSLLDYEFYLNDKDALEAILEALASEIAMSLSSLRDQINAGLQSITNMLAPLTDLGSSGTISGEGTQAGQSETLFTIHQGVGSGVTPVGIQLTGAGRRFLSTAGAARLAVSLTFRPVHGAAVSIRRLVALSPPLSFSS